MNMNNLGQPVGVVVSDWEPPCFPPHKKLEGNYCCLEPLDVDRHAESLYSANALDVDGKNWTYLPYGPFDNFKEYTAWLSSVCSKTDPQFYAIVDITNGRALGVASYLRINPEAGSIEVGHLCYSPLLQKSKIATETMYLLMREAFKLGYRRYEWKCNALNQKSYNAAERLGFLFEGVFRNATVVKGRNRDTSWFSIIDSEWPFIEKSFTRWLSPSNFDDEGVQIDSLSKIRNKIKKQ